MKLTLQDRELDLETGRFLDGDGRLTQFECRLLRFLVSLDGRPASRDVLLTEVWDYPSPVQTRAIDTAIRRLRRKIEPDPSDPRALLTVQGEGYRLVVKRPTPSTDEFAGWEAARVEAESFFDRPLALHDPEVGVHAAIVRTVRDRLAALPAGTHARLAPFLVSRSGFTAAEAGLDAEDLRRLVGASLLHSGEGRYRLADPWWGAVQATPEGRAQAVRIWVEREAPNLSIDEVELALSWAEATDEQHARLILKVAPRMVQAGEFTALARWTGRPFAALPAPTRIDLLLEEANALRALGDLQRARAQAAAASEVAAQQAPERLGDARGLQGLLAHTDADYDAAASGYADAVALLELTQPGLAATFLAELGIVTWVMGRGEDGLAHTQRARTMASARLLSAPQDTVAKAAELRASRSIASILVGLGRNWEAIPRIEAMATAAERAGLQSNVIAALMTGGRSMMDAGELEQADQWLQRALAQARAAGEILQTAAVESEFGILYHLRGDLEAAEAAQERAIRVFQDNAIAVRTIVPRCWAAIAAHARGRSAEAVERLQTATQALNAVGKGSPGVIGTVGLASRVLGIAGPDIPIGAEQQVYFRVARRAWQPDVDTTS